LELRRRDQANDLLSPVASGGETGRAIVIEPWVKASPRRNAGAQAGARTPEARLAEAVGLARAIDLTIVQAGRVTLNDTRPATYIGKGKVDEIAGMVKSLSASIVHPREVFRTAILEATAHLILVHNHPSGDPTPSKEDVHLTRQLVEGARLLGLRVHDHVIIGRGSHVSLAQRGLI